MLNVCLMHQIYTTMVTSKSDRFRCHFGTVINSQSKGLLVRLNHSSCLFVDRYCLWLR